MKTFKRTLGIAAAAVVLLATTAMVPKVAANDDVQLEYAQYNAQCLVLGHSLDIPKADLKVYVARVGEYDTDPDIGYIMGYITGIVEATAAHAAIQAKVSFAQAKYDTTEYYYYKVLKCSTAISM